MATIDRVAHCLTDEVSSERPAAEAMAVEQRALVPDVVGLGQGKADVEVVAPAGQFEAVEAPASRLGGQLLERQVGPLASEQRHRSCHLTFLSPLAQGVALASSPRTRHYTPAPVAVSYDFEGRTALITGEAGDVGAAVARRIMAAGGRVATLDVRPAELDGGAAIECYTEEITVYRDV